MQKVSVSFALVPLGFKFQAININCININVNFESFYYKNLLVKYQPNIIENRTVYTVQRNPTSHVFNC